MEIRKIVEKMRSDEAGKASLSDIKVHTTILPVEAEIRGKEIKGEIKGEEKIVKKRKRRSKTVKRDDSKKAKVTRRTSGVSGGGESGIFPCDW